MQFQAARVPAGKLELTCSQWILLGLPRQVSWWWMHSEGGCNEAIMGEGRMGRQQGGLGPECVGLAADPFPDSIQWCKSTAEDYPQIKERMFPYLDVTSATAPHRMQH